MAKILKNTTGSDIDLEILGRRIIASSQITVETSDYMRLAGAESVSELSPLITSGDIVVNDGTADLSVSEGIAYLQYPDQALNSRFDNSSNDFDSDTEQEAIEEARDTTIGKMFSVTFFADGVVFGTDFMAYGDGLGTSDDIPYVVPYNCRLVALSYTNEDDGTDGTIDVRAADYNSGNSDTSRYTISFTNVRTGCRSGITGVSFNAGDKIAVTISDDGTNPDEPRVELWFQIDSTPDQTLTENWSGSF